MVDNKSEQKLHERLKQLPKIKDNQPKELLFEKIQSHAPSRTDTHKSDNGKQAKRWIIPSFAGVAVAALLFILVHSGVFLPGNNGNEEIASRAEDSDFSLMESKESSDFDSAETEAEEEVEIEQDEVLDTANNVVQDEPSNRMVYYQDQNELPMFTVAGADMQGMYVIPFTLVSTSSTGNPNDYYNRINSFITQDESNLGIWTFPFEDISFEFSEGNEDIYMTVDDDYQFPAGSTNAALFQEMLNTMFAGYPTDHIITQTDSMDGIDLGPIGYKEQLDIVPITNQVYKIYQYQDNQRLLVPISRFDPGEYRTLEDAFFEMQQSEEEFDVYASIPAEASYQIITDQSRLVLSFSELEQFGNNSTTYEMIQAILVTADSFGFSEVDFTIPGVEGTIGQFNLEEPVPVPDGINPIILH